MCKFKSTLVFFTFPYFVNLTNTTSYEMKIADANFINELIQTVLIQKGLCNYLNNVYYTNEMESSGKSLSVAFYNGKDLFISLNALQLYFLNTKGNYISNFTGIEYAMYLNSILSQVILHELEHIAQYKMTLNQIIL